MLPLMENLLTENPLPENPLTKNSLTENTLTGNPLTEIVTTLWKTDAITYVQVIKPLALATQLVS